MQINADYWYLMIVTLCFDLLTPNIVPVPLKEEKLEKMATSAALPLEVDHPASHSALFTNVLSYQIPTKSDNPRLYHRGLTISNEQCRLSTVARAFRLLL